MSIGKGVVSGGDGSMVVNGIGGGVTFIGTSVSVVSGAARGVFSGGKGFFSGVTSVGKGLVMLFKARSLHEIERSQQVNECRFSHFTVMQVENKSYEFSIPQSCK